MITFYLYVLYLFLFHEGRSENILNVHIAAVMTSVHSMKIDNRPIERVEEFKY
jgi:hypothetical protein